MPRAQSNLFETILIPPGMSYREDFLSTVEERELISWFEHLPLEHPQFNNYHAKRRCMNFGWTFNFENGTIVPGPALPPALAPLARKVAKWLDIPQTRIVEALVTEYPPQTAIGWHRDNETCDVIVGVSLQGWCTLQLRPLRTRGRRRAKDVMSISLAPRSVYVLSGESRWLYQHAISPVPDLRYSVTLRTLPSHVASPRRAYH